MGESTEVLSDEMRMFFMAGDPSKDKERISYLNFLNENKDVAKRTGRYFANAKKIYADGAGLTVLEEITPEKWRQAGYENMAKIQELLNNVKDEAD